MSATLHPSGALRSHAAAWRVRARLFYRAWRYRWKTDRAEIAFLFAHVRPGSIALDIGAHKGAYTYWLARRVGAAGRVHAFEPQPQLAGSLRFLFDPTRVEVVNAGVSEREGTLPLHIPTKGSPSPSATLETTKTGDRDSHTMEVPIVTIDRVLSQRTRPVSFIKCDVEGHELSVFRGAERILREDQPVLLFECEQRHRGPRPMQEVFTMLAGLGYRGYFFCRGRLLPISEFVPALHQPAVKHGPYCNNFGFLPRLVGIDRGLV